MALFLIVLFLLFLSVDNARWPIWHLGGALAGWWFASGLQHGHDVTRWINWVIDFIGGGWSPKPRKPKMKVHYGGGRQQDYDFNARKKAQAAEVDRILDKLRKSG